MPRDGRGWIVFSAAGQEPRPEWTALMAIARKVIVLDYKELEPEYIWATAAIILALSVGYWLVTKKLQ